mmetsp:Transcript_15491/g.33581  ORF Transcript_15491/g.33581 Transcript_15491/m.33581 type:complete len:228 (+) Transcript_15491:1093-1776(+)
MLSIISMMSGSGPSMADSGSSSSSPPPPWSTMRGPGKSPRNSSIGTCCPPPEGASNTISDPSGSLPSMAIPEDKGPAPPPISMEIARSSSSSRAFPFPFPVLLLLPPPPGAALPARERRRSRSGGTGPGPPILTGPPNCSSKLSGSALAASGTNREKERATSGNNLGRLQWDPPIAHAWELFLLEHCLWERDGECDSAIACAAVDSGSHTTGNIGEFEGKGMSEDTV